MKENVLLLCHNYAAPFLSVAKQYVKLFDDSNYNVVTVFLKQEESQEVIDECAPSEVNFCNYPTKNLRGLKRKPIRFVRELHKKYN